MISEIERYNMLSAVLDFVEDINERANNGDRFLNTVDITAYNLAVDLLNNKCTIPKENVVERLKYLKEYTGDPDIMPPELFRKAIDALLTWIEKTR